MSNVKKINFLLNWCSMQSSMWLVAYRDDTEYTCRLYCLGNKASVIIVTNSIIQCHVLLAYWCYHNLWYLMVEGTNARKTEKHSVEWQNWRNGSEMDWHKSLTVLEKCYLQRIWHFMPLFSSVWISDWSHSHRWEWKGQKPKEGIKEIGKNGGRPTGDGS